MNPHVISCEFNNFFAQMGSSLSKNIKPSHSNPLGYIKGSLSPLLQFEKLLEIGKLKLSAAGDDIGASLIKYVSSSI